MRAGRRVVAGLGALLVAGCGAGDPSARFARPPWPSAHTVVAVPVGATGEAAGAPQVFAPGDPVEWSLAADAQLRLLTFEAGEDIARCGAATDSAFPRLPTPDGAYLVVAADGDLDLVADPGAAPALRYATCAPPTDEPECPQYEVRRYEATVAPDRDPTALAMSEEGALVALSAALGPDEPHLLRLDDGALVPLPSDPALGPTPLLDLEAAGGLIFGLNAAGVFEIDAQGRATRIGEASPSARGLVALDADSVAAFGPGGLEPVMGDVPPIEDPVEDAWNAGHPQSGGYAFALTAYGVLRLRDGAWVLDDRFQQESWQVLGGDASVVLAGNQLGQIQRRRGPEDWTSLGAPPGNGSRVRTIAGIGGGRAMIGGNDGLLAVWSGKGWCTLPPFVVTPVVDLEVDGTMVFGVHRHVESLVGDAGGLFRLMPTAL